MSIQLFVGGSRLPGIYTDRCHSAVANPRSCDAPVGEVLLDSGAFSDKPAKRLTFAGALERSLRWESQAAKLWGKPDWRLDVVASYDYLLIDEEWRDGARRKKRWPDGEGWSAVEVSVAASEYLASRRAEIAPRTLLFGCQGVTTTQYVECAKGILAVAAAGDWFGFGGRCILGRQKSLLDQHYESALEVVPLIAQKGLGHVHIYGVLYEPAIAPLAWLCDQHGLDLSTDSAAPAVATKRRDETSRLETLRRSWARSGKQREMVAGPYG